MDEANLSAKLGADDLAERFLYSFVTNVTNY